MEEKTVPAGRMWSGTHGRLPRSWFANKPREMTMSMTITKSQTTSIRDAEPV